MWCIRINIFDIDMSICHLISILSLSFDIFSITKNVEKMKSVYGDDCLRWTRVFALHEEFSDGREAAKLCNSQHSRLSPTLSTKINVNTVRTLINKDCSLTYREMVAMMDYSMSTIKNIMKKLGMRCVAWLWVLHHLMKQQLQQCVDVCTCLKNKYQDGPLIHVPWCYMRWNVCLTLQP